MTPSGNHPAPPATFPPAIEAKEHLDDALAQAHFAARVDAGDDGKSLHLTVFSQAFDRTVEAATTWLAEAGVDGTATLDEALNLVITLPTAAAVDQLATTLLEPRIRAHTAADDLAELLSCAGLGHHISLLGTHAVEVTLADDDLADDDLGAAVRRFAALLGASSIDDGLTLNRHRGVRRLAERLEWLVTGAVGSAVRTETTPGCAHAPNRIALQLTIDQARHLTQRLFLASADALTAVGTDRAVCRTGTGGAA
ncbi:hypothetical protein [Streptomyces sp. enrichment culture]|uniref:hypothetical protein n=1 Tax=Streptomyces sp. enrichment culture TaxID=1795815 RepID=UPI003F559EA3